jgi:hypothetical protein
VPCAAATPLAVPGPRQSKQLQPCSAARPNSPKPSGPSPSDLHTHQLPPAYTKALADVGKPAANIIKPTNFMSLMCPQSISRFSLGRLKI